MPLYRVTATLNKISGVPIDAVQNVWHVSQDEVVPDHTDDIANAFVAFYQAISARLSPALSAASNAHTIEVATVTVGGPGQGDDAVSSPVRVTPFDIGTPGDTFSSLPNEVAVALSLVGDLSGLPEESGSTRPRSRRRGRVYLGPLSTGAIVQDGGTGEVFIYATFMDEILDAAEALSDALVADDSALMIYSRVGGSSTPVLSAFVDNAPDTVRSRGQVAGARDTRVLVP